MGITMFISLYATRLILNSLGASDFGIFNIVGGAIAMLGFLNVAMASATQRFMSYSEGAGDKEKQKSIFNISVILHFFIAIIIGIVLLIAGYFFFHGILNIPVERIHAAQMVYYFMIVSTMLTVMTVPYDAVLNAHENMLYYAVVGIIESVLKLAVALVVVYTLADKLIIYGALMAGISLLVMMIMRVYCHKKYVECEFKPRTYYDNDLMNGTYRRNAEGDYRCSLPEIKAMLRDQSDIPIDSTVFEEITFNDLDKETIARYRNMFRVLKPEHIWNRLDNIEFLHKIGTLGRAETSELKPSLAGLVMFADEEVITRVLPDYFLDYREKYDND
jgi:hypothetical protein